MSLRQLASDVDIAWDGGISHVPAGTLVDVPPGSALESAYGMDNLMDLDAGAAAAAADHAGVSN